MRLTRSLIGLASLVVLVAGLPTTAAAATRVNVMPDRQVRPCTAATCPPNDFVPIWGSIDGGAGPLAGEQYEWVFAPNPNVQVIAQAPPLSGAVANKRYIVENVAFKLLNGVTRAVVTATLKIDNDAIVG